MSYHPTPCCARRILIVDDNEDAAELLSILMSAFGHETCIAYNGSAGIALAVCFRPDIIFLDLGMPEMSGYTVIEKLRQNTAMKRVCIAAVTGWDDALTRQKVKNAGFNFHIPKPAHVDALLRVVNLCSLADINWFES